RHTGVGERRGEVAVADVAVAAARTRGGIEQLVEPGTRADRFERAGDILATDRAVDPAVACADIEQGVAGAAVEQELRGGLLFLAEAVAAVFRYRAQVVVTDLAVRLADV